jgi:hypothetical protein
MNISAPEERVAGVARRARGDCLIHATKRKEKSLAFRLLVNGEQIRL